MVSLSVSVPVSVGSRFLVGMRSRASGVARQKTGEMPSSPLASGILIRFGEILRVKEIGSAAFSCVRLYIRRRTAGCWRATLRRSSGSTELAEVHR